MCFLIVPILPKRFVVYLDLFLFAIVLKRFELVPYMPDTHFSIRLFQFPYDLKRLEVQIIFLQKHESEKNNNRFFKEMHSFKLI